MAYMAECLIENKKSFILHVVDYHTKDIKYN